ncbi:thermonuclease family protein [Macrococcoides canis]|uniref:thermonuclease family protein n=1 Tax=Macrococcoides canis TaxID=1855823 RepID=UPI001FB75566|nr:thermonuclease family protein [Macrococcus canis]
MNREIIAEYLRDQGEDFDFLIEADLNTLTTTKYALIKEDSPMFNLVDIDVSKKEITKINSKGKTEKLIKKEITQHQIIKSFDISDCTSVDIDKFALSRVYTFENGEIIRINQNHEPFEEYLSHNNITFNIKDREWYQKIIGFRSGTVWKMIISFLIFLTLLFLLISLLPSTVNAVLIPFLGIASFIGVLYYGVRLFKNISKKNYRTFIPFSMFLGLLFLFITVSEAQEDSSNSDTKIKNNPSKSSIVSTTTKSNINSKKEIDKNTTNEEVIEEKVTTEKPTTEKPATEKPEDTTIDKNKIGTTSRFPVYFSRHVDGDTSVLNIDGVDKKFRYLLIDTPETKHPRTGVQPFGHEAAARTEELLSNASKIEVEYDVGEKTDKYDRDLVYVYVDGKMINEILVREGLASVSYVYPPNTRYLDTLKNAETLAKSEKLGIWSLDSAFENGDSNQNVNTNENTQNTEPNQNNQYSNFVQQQPSNTIQSFANCTELRQVYPEGVPSTHPAYNSKMDRDGDNFACEAS